MRGKDTGAQAGRLPGILPSQRGDQARLVQRDTERWPCVPYLGALFQGVYR